MALNWVDWDATGKMAVAGVSLIALAATVWIHRRVHARNIADSISSKRFEWLEELRKDIATFLFNVDKAVRMFRPNANYYSQKNNFTVWKDSFQEYEHAASLASARIGLRLTDSYIRSSDLTAALESIGMCIVMASKEISFADHEKNINTYLDERKKVVASFAEIEKHEWDRLKSGNAI